MENKDAVLEADIVQTSGPKKVTLSVTPQRLSELENGVRILKRGEKRECLVKDFMAQNDQGIRRTDNLASAVVDGLEFFTR